MDWRHYENFLIRASLFLLAGSLATTSIATADQLNLNIGNIRNSLPSLPQILSTPKAIAPVALPSVTSAPNATAPNAIVPNLVPNIATPNIGVANLGGPNLAAPSASVPTANIPLLRTRDAALPMMPSAVAPQASGMAHPAVFAAPTANQAPGLRQLPPNALPKFHSPSVPLRVVPVFPSTAAQQVTTGTFQMNSGQTLVSTRQGARQAVVPLSNGGRLLVSKNAEVLLTQENGLTRVQNLSGTGRSVIVQTPNDQNFAIDPGYEFVQSTNPLTPEQLQPNDNVARRNTTLIGDGTAAVSEISLPSVLRHNAVLQTLRSSVAATDKAIVSDLMKTAAALSVVRGGNGFSTIPAATTKLVRSLVPTDTLARTPVTIPSLAPPSNIALVAQQPQASGPSQFQQHSINQGNAVGPQVSPAQSQVPANPSTQPLTYDQTRPFVTRSLSQIVSSPARNNRAPDMVRALHKPMEVNAIKPSPGVRRIAAVPASSSHSQTQGASAPSGAGQTSTDSHNRAKRQTGARSPAETLSEIPHEIAIEVQRHPDVTAGLLVLLGMLLLITALLGKTARDRALELAAINKQLAVARDQAIESSRLKSEFVANISHEIRTPVTAVLGTIGLLFETDLDDKQSELATILRDSARSLLEVINDILDFSKIEAGKMKIESVDFSVAGVLKEAHDALAGAAQNKNLTFELSTDSGVPAYVAGDPHRVKQILLNLVGNAIKFTPSGTVLMSAGLAPQVSSDDRPWIRFKVKDTGIGINESSGRALFQPFVQADGSTTRQFGGTGLGLSISKRLVELMGGKIGFSSEVGKGTEFWFDLPFAAASPVDAAVGAAPHVTRGTSEMVTKPNTVSGAKVLVAEDNAVLRKIVQTQLQKLGYVVDLANNGVEALESARNGNYAIVLMDWQMPEMDGLSATRAIRQLDNEMARVPIIAMTANAMEGDRKSCMEAGMNDYISKPFSAEQLKGMIEKWTTR